VIYITKNNIYKYVSIQVIRCYLTDIESMIHKCILEIKQNIYNTDFSFEQIFVMIHDYFNNKNFKEKKQYYMQFAYDIWNEFDDVLEIIKVGLLDLRKQYIQYTEEDDSWFRDMVKTHFGVNNIEEFVDFCECQIMETIIQIDSRYFNKIDIKRSDNNDYSI